jgi:hypothetical protein
MPIINNAPKYIVHILYKFEVAQPTRYRYKNIFMNFRWKLIEKASVINPLRYNNFSSFTIRHNIKESFEKNINYPDLLNSFNCSLFSK